MKKLFAFLLVQSNDNDTLNRLLIVVNLAILIFTIVIITILGFTVGIEGVSACILSAAACYAGGAVVGFLFGIPKSEKYRFKADVNHSEKSNFYSDNTNLEEISDWLTKIMVGLSLVKARTILGWLDQGATNLGNAIRGACPPDGDCPNLYVLGYSLIVLYIIVGAGITYLWTRTYLPQILTDARKLQLEVENKELEVKNKQLQAIALDAANADMTPSNGEAKLMEQNVGDLTDDNIEKFKIKVQKIYGSTRVFQPDDLQKKRWGGSSEKNKWQLYADVVPKFGTLGKLFKVTMRVQSIDLAQKLDKPVAFFLHDTFPTEIVYALPDVNGIAQYQVRAYEAFTIGALVDDENQTTLELDLNEVPGYPRNFYWK